MRISCEYKTDKFPIAYQMLGVSLVKEALKKVDKDYFNKLYKFEDDKVNKSAKDFCFSVYMKDFEKQQDIFLIKDKVIISFSSPDYEFILKLYNGLLNINNFEYKEFNINKERIRLVKEKSINGRTVIFNTLSPMHIKDINNNPLDVEDENFEKELNYIANKTLESYRGFGLKEQQEFESINMRKKVVKQEIRVFKENTSKSYFYVNGYAGMFKLEGDVNDLKDIYMLGIGFKRSQGFGMLEIVE